MRSACERCARFKKRCVPAPGGCDRCARSGSRCSLDPASGGLAATHPAVCAPAALLGRFMALSDASLADLEEAEGWNQKVHTGSPGFSLSALDCITLMAETPLIDMEDSKGELEHLDLMPTIDDWAFIFSAMCGDGSEPPFLVSQDCDLYLKEFFHLPPLVRTVHLMFMSYLMAPHLTPKYYKQTRKAVVRALMEKPTFQTVQGLFILALFFGRKGQPALATSLTKIMVDLIQDLRLFIDPDESPWLFHLNLTPRQKEDRRRAFWLPYELILIESATSTKEITSIPFNSDYIKAPAFVFDGYMIFKGCPLNEKRTRLWSFIITVKKHLDTPPKSIFEHLATNSTFSLLQSQLNSLRSLIPSEHLLTSEHPERLTAQDCTRFNEQISKEVPATDLCTFNAVLMASICVLNRPNLYMSSLKSSCHPLSLSHEQQSIISNSINNALDAAHGMVNLLQYFLSQTVGAPFLPNNYMNMYLFEAMVVLWFASCRMDPIWWVVLQRDKMDYWTVLRGRMMMVIQYVKSVEQRENIVGGLTPPLLNCVQAMVQEIDNHEKCLLGQLPAMDDVQIITLGMQVVSLEGDDVVGEESEPRALLGLLGMQVGGGIRWPGRTEESWRLFWKLNS
ncbi:hypothetical protein BDR26DRAFT_1007710 [Obelidium mucronatum]|nr:hypothetical protein BDR26DRAFT_1007710 [Obelidium mucronatum]